MDENLISTIVCIVVVNLATFDFRGEIRRRQALSLLYFFPERKVKFNFVFLATNYIPKMHGSS